MALLLACGLLGGASAALGGPGDFSVNVGGINRTQQGGGPVPRIDKPQTGLNNFSAVPDTSNRRTDNTIPVGNNFALPDGKGAIDPTTFSFSNGGTFVAPPTPPGQPGSGFCSNNEVTVGENTQGRLHCSNTVNPVNNGTLRN